MSEHTNVEKAQEQASTPCTGSNRFHIDVRPNENGHTIDDVLWGVLLMKLNLLLEDEGFDYLGAYLEEYD